MLEIAREQIPRGIYAVEKNDYAELLCDKCTSTTQLKAMIRAYKSQGFKVYANRKGGLKTADNVTAEGALMGAT